MPRKPAQPLPKALAKVTDAAITVDDWVATVGDDVEAMAEIFGVVDDAIHTLLYVRDAVKVQLLKRSTYKKTDDWMGWTLGEHRFPFPLPGGGLLMRRGGKEATRYDQDAVIGDVSKGITHELLKKDVAARCLDSEGTIVPLEQVVERVCRRMAEASGATAPSFTNWRNGVATQLGYDLKKHAETRTTDVTLSVEGRRAS